MTEKAGDRRYDEASALVFADTEQGRADGTALIACTLGWAAHVSSIEAGAEESDAAVSTGVVLVDVRGDGGAPFERLLDRLQAAAQDARHPSVVCVPAALIDVAAARATHPDVQLLVNAGAFERGVALGLAATGRRIPPALGEERRDSDQLLQLSEEVGRIARALAMLSEAGERRDRGLPLRAGPAAPPSAGSVRALIRARRLRDQFFESRLFADPAWDMLLDLLAARIEEQAVAVSSLCIAAAVPPTTALRWMKQLTADGLLVRVADPGDRRRVFIELADDVAAQLHAYFHALEGMGVVLT